MEDSETESQVLSETGLSEKDDDAQVATLMSILRL